MLRLAVLTALLVAAAWFAREAGWMAFPRQVAANIAPHDRYQDSLERAGLLETPLGRAWHHAGKDAIAAATPTSLPATEQLNVDAHQPDAWAFRVTLRRGQRLEVLADLRSNTPAQTFVDIFTPAEQPSASDAVNTAATTPTLDLDTVEHEIGAVTAAAHEATSDGELVVRVQPELLASGSVALEIRAVPSLRFPVANARPRDLQSVFGDPREAGRRQHEGVDIFARRGTPVLSATDGVVLRVGETRLGGRVVWVWDLSRGLRLYYAHLDQQLVATGQRVTRGDTLGTVGNTGNARSTPPHLHFGIYERGTGAIDPYWFIAPPRQSTTRASR
jgi:murein DD-endopeptidase MepM/ murein hydrolase activator NlpD